MIEHRRPDIVVVEKDNKVAFLIDIAVSRDSGVEEEQENVDKYQNLAQEIKRLWKVSTNIIPVMVTVLGTTPKSLERKLKRTGTTVKFMLLQKAALLGTA